MVASLAALFAAVAVALGPHGVGLVFYDDALHDPEPPSSRIVEIKIGTCGDF